MARFNSPFIIHHSSLVLSSCRHFLRLLTRLFDGSDHIESLFGHIVAFSVEDFAETFDRVFDFDVLAGQTRKFLADEKRL